MFLMQKYKSEKKKFWVFKNQEARIFDLNVKKTKHLQVLRHFFFFLTEALS